MTKEQAIKILQDAYDRGIDPDGDIEIFPALKLAIAALQSDQETPDWSRAAGAKGGENDSVTVKLPKI